ncbi:MAG: hypothetical protein HOC23_11995 [Halieaceae bacterium]|jgi:general secretion pathway protein L|nr:hypothetical protein [Halieaceae bacterium]
MLEASQQWNLFGYDLRQGLFFFQAGWRDFLWGKDSPVLPYIDETVIVHREQGEPVYSRMGQAISQPVNHQALQTSAVLLPDRLVLPKTLIVPKAAEGSLTFVVAMEVQANSPFPEGDTCYGWRVTGITDKGLEVQLVISSSSAIMEFIADQLDCHDIHAYEVWAEIDNNSVVLSGFGEVARQVRNRKRVIQAGLGIGYCLVVLVACFAVATGMKYLELRQVREIYQETEQRATRAVELRSALSKGKQQVATINSNIAENPDPYTELSRLTGLMDDSTWLDEVSVDGSRMRITGHSVNAATVMQKLIDEPAYGEITAPAPIRKENRTGTERFTLDLRTQTEVKGP